MKAKKLPKRLPALPKGAVYIGKGPINLPNGVRKFSGWAWENGEETWSPAQNYGGSATDLHYAVPNDSPILDENPANQSFIQSPPWAIIQFNEKKQQWEFLTFSYTRQSARNIVGIIKRNTPVTNHPKLRIVRASIPTK